MTHTHAQDGEHLVHVINEHWVKYIIPVLIAVFLFAVGILLFVLAGITAHHNMWLSHGAYVAALIVFLATTHWLFMMILSETLERIIITNRRLMRMHYKMLFDEDVLEISFQKMKTVDSKKHGLIQNILQYGTIYFETKLAAIPFVPHPNRVAGIIQEAMNQKD